MDSDDLKLEYWFYHGWLIYKENLKKILLAALVFSIFGWIGWALVRYLPYGILLSRVFGLVLGPALMGGFGFFCLALTRGNLGCSRDFLAGFLHFGKVWVTNTLLMLIVIVGLVLFVIPGIIWSCKYGFSVLSALDKKLSPLSAIKFSSKITCGHKVKLFVLSLLVFVIFISQLPLRFVLQDPTKNWGFPFVILALILRIFSDFVVSPWLFTIWATAYDALSKRHDNRT